MKNKKLIGLLLCLVLAISVVGGCSSKPEEPDYDAIEAQIEEDIVGAWKSGEGGYMIFFDNGKAGLILSPTEYELMPYEVDGNTITLEASASTMELTSASVTKDTLTYSFGEGKHVWHSCPVEEAEEYIE